MPREKWTSIEYFPVSSKRAAEGFLTAVTPEEQEQVGRAFRQAVLANVQAKAAASLARDKRLQEAELASRCR